MEKEVSVKASEKVRKEDAEANIETVTKKKEKIENKTFEMNFVGANCLKKSISRRCPRSGRRLLVKAILA